MVSDVGKQTMVKKAARNKMAVRNKNGRKRAEKIFASRQWSKRQPGIKWQSGIKMAEKGPKKFSRFMRHGL